MSSLLANYESERQFFQRILQPDCQERILLFIGESGTGKTTLLKACLEDTVIHEEKLKHVPIQLRQSAVGVSEIFYRLGGFMGWEHLGTFLKQVDAFQVMPTVHIQENRMIGQNQIEVALNTGNPTDRAHRRAALTNAWFSDLRSYPALLLMVLDTYEDANAELQEWIEGPFLARVAQSSNLRVLLAGQKVPDNNNIEWGHCCQKRDLFGVHEASHWMPIIRDMKRHIDAPDPLSWMAGICHILKGRPSAIMQVIEDLPQLGVGT